MQLAQSGYPVNLDYEPQITGRNRLTTAFRLILSIPHIFIAGLLTGSSAGGSSNRDGSTDSGDFIMSLISVGILGIAAGVMAVVSWFAILFTGRHPKSFWEFEYWVLRWQTRATAYFFLIRDEFPPFGEGEYGAQMDVANPDSQRNRLTVFFRFFMLIPHLVVLIFLDIAWVVVTVIAWFAILFTGNYPEGMYGFGTGVLRWHVRVSAYGYLLRDEYPPFSLSA